MATLAPLSQVYSTRRDMPYTSTATLSDMYKNMMWLLYSWLTNQQAGGTLGPNARDPNTVWTVQETSNGAGSVLSSDQLGGGTYDAARWVFANNGTNHTWVRLRNTHCGYEILIDMNSTTPGNGRISAAPIATPFTGGTATSGPTSTQEFMFRNHTPSVSANSAMMNDQVTGGLNYAHGTAGADGSWIFQVSRAGAAVSVGIPTFIHFARTTDAAVTDTNNWVLMGSSSNGTRGSPTHGEIVSTSNITFRLPSGSPSGGQGGGGPSNLFGGTQYAGNTSYGTDGLTGKYKVFPIRVIALAPQTVDRGRLLDVYYIAGCPQVGLGVTEGGLVTRIISGDVVTPFNGGAPIC